MPNFIRAQARINMASAIPADAVVNTFHFRDDANLGIAAAVDKIEEQLVRFYTNIDGLVFPNTVAAVDGLNIKTFNLADATPRVPIRSTTYTIAPSAVAPQPHELAMVISWKAPPESGVQIQSLRGRTYVGPTNINCTTAGRIAAATVTALVTAADELATESAADNIDLAIYSPTRHAAGATLEESFRLVSNGYVDNAWDVIRSRGVLASSRNLFTV